METARMGIEVHITDHDNGQSHIEISSLSYAENRQSVLVSTHNSSIEASNMLHRAILLERSLDRGETLVKDYEDDDYIVWAPETD